MTAARIITNPAPIGESSLAPRLNREPQFFIPLRLVPLDWLKRPRAFVRTLARLLARKADR